jgi:hypothetical protein
MFSQVFIRSTTCRLNSTLCRRHFAILAPLAILPPFAYKVRLFRVSHFWGSVHGRGFTIVGRDPWQANLVKLASNFIIVSLIETLGEAFALMRKAGISVHQFLEMANTLFGSPIFGVYGQMIADEKYEPAGFRMKLGLKDVKLALAAAEEQAVPMPLAGIIRDHFLQGIALGYGDQDWAAIARVIADNAGIERPRA